MGQSRFNHSKSCSIQIPDDNPTSVRVTVYSVGDVQIGINIHCPSTGISGSYVMTYEWHFTTTNLFSDSSNYTYNSIIPGPTNISYKQKILPISMGVKIEIIFGLFGF